MATTRAPLTILYGSQTGCSEAVAELVAVEAARRCFAPRCPGQAGLLRGERPSHLLSGHDCYNVLAKALGAEAALGFVWPPIAQTVRATNPHYELPRCAEIDAGAPYGVRACRDGMKQRAKGAAPARGGASAKPLVKARPGSLKPARRMMARSGGMALGRRAQQGRGAHG